MFHVKHLLLFKGFNPSKSKAPATENYPLYAGEGKQTFYTKKYLSWTLEHFVIEML